MKNKLKSTKFLTVCLTAAGILSFTQSAYAAKLQNINDARAKALQKVPNATITDADQDYEKGVLVYDIELVKGNKKYDIMYRASDAKILEYEWESIVVRPSSSAMISESKCRSLAQQKVKKGTIVSITQKYDDGIEIYKVKMTKGSKTYTLKYHGRTGALLSYDWELKSSASTPGSSTSKYIGLKKAKRIALNSVPGATVVKAEFDTDDGVPVYEIELIKGSYEYEFKIHAQTGAILEQEKDWND